MSKELVGKWFHSLEDGKIKWQGRIIDEPKENMYQVELFSWLFGESTGYKLIDIDDMKGWLFYDTNADMKFSREYGIARVGGHYCREEIK